MSIRKFNLNIFITQTPFPNNYWKHHVVSRHHRSLSHTCKIHARVINQTINTKIGSNLSTKASIKKCRWSSLLLPLFQFRSTYTDTCISHPYRHRDSCRSPSNTFVSRGFEKKDFEILYVWREMERNLDEIKKKFRQILVKDEDQPH